MNNISKLFFTITLAATLAACEANKMVPTPNVVKFNSSSLYPEGVEWDNTNKRFLVTSIRKGEIGSVKDDGSYWVFAKDPRMISSVGIHIDKKRDRVLVCNADAGAAEKSSPDTAGKVAALAVFQLSTGNLTKYINLAKGIDGAHFCNDIALDKDGTAYITDSFSPIIYKVDTNYNSSVLINNKTFSGKSFNLNGIVVKDDYLLVVKMNSGQLFKIPLNNPDSFHEVKLKNRIEGADGLIWGEDGSLVVIANNNAHIGVPASTAPTNAVIKLTSNDNWASASVVSKVGTGDVFASTGTIRNDQIYVIHAMLHVLFNPKTKKHLEQFEIRKYKL
jgi:sugar lactone lactonase YvrE